MGSQIRTNLIKRVLLTLLSVGVFSLSLINTGCEDESCEDQCKNEFPFNWQNCTCDFFGPYIPAVNSLKVKLQAEDEFPIKFYSKITRTSGTCSSSGLIDKQQILGYNLLLDLNQDTATITCGEKFGSLKAQWSSSKSTVKLTGNLALATQLGCSADIKATLKTGLRRKIANGRSRINLDVSCAGVKICSESLRSGKTSKIEDKVCSATSSTNTTPDSSSIILNMIRAIKK
jgi:hypothetical protein